MILLVMVENSSYDAVRGCLEVDLKRYNVFNKGALHGLDDNEVQKQSTDFVDSSEKWQKVSYGQQQRIWRRIEDEFSLFIARYCGASTPQSFHSLLQQDWLRKQRCYLPAGF